MNLLQKLMKRHGVRSRTDPGMVQPDLEAVKADLPEPTPRVQKRRLQYDALVAELTAKYDIRIKRWRRSTSGMAWTVRTRNGAITKWIESPYPTGPVSCAVFLHEVGHHAIGLGIHKPRCLEEYLAWQWALRMMEERKLNVTSGVQRRVERSMRYAVSKAMRRGIKRLPAELAPYL